MSNATDTKPSETSPSVDGGCSGVDMCLSCLRPTLGRGVILGCLCGECGLEFVKTGKLPGPRKPGTCICGSTDWNSGGPLGAHCCRCDRDLVLR